MVGLKQTLAVIFVVAVLCNYPWELAQWPLYLCPGNVSAVLWRSFVASLGDGLLVLLIFATGWAVLRRREWFVQPEVHGYLLMLGMGLVISIGIEWVAVYVLERWAYAAWMPLVPGLGVGIAPVAQMLVLPPLIFRIVAARATYRRSRNNP